MADRYWVVRNVPIDRPHVHQYPEPGRHGAGTIIECECGEQFIMENFGTITLGPGMTSCGQPYTWRQLKEEERIK